MNNNIKVKNSNQVTIQLKKAEVQKNILIKKIYKEYENYFQIVRNSILTSVKKGIFGLYSDLSVSNKELNKRELNNFLNKNISLLIHSKLPLITIEQLKLEDISDNQKQLVNLNSIKEMIEFKESPADDFDYENELNTIESLELNCNNNPNTYQYYASLSEDEISSVNLDEISNLSSCSKKYRNKNIENKKYILNSALKLIEDTNDNKSNDFTNIDSQLNDVFISSENLDFFEIIDKSFSHFLLNLSYKINSELFKINLINKIISEDTFKCLSNNNYIIKHPYPFVIKYDLHLNKLPLDINVSSNIYLFNLNNVELEFYNLDLEICRNNLNELKNRFRSLIKKQRYWKHKEIKLINLNK